MDKFLRSFLDKISYRQRRKLISLTNFLKTIGKTSDLNYLAQVYKTDKWGKHFYTPHYKNHFLKFKNAPVRLLEIGVGGYDRPREGAGSLRMWKRFFTRGKIYAIDIFDKSELEESRIRIFKGSQVDDRFLDQVLSQTGELDIIIDDGSHINDHVLTTFKYLFPKLKMGGIYVIEDVQTSYWPDFNGSSVELNRQDTIMGFFKSLTDGLNHSEYLKGNYIPSYYDQHITSIHFYHNLIFVYKGLNMESSNILS